MHSYACFRSFRSIPPIDADRPAPSVFDECVHERRALPGLALRHFTDHAGNIHQHRVTTSHGPIPFAR